jgi:hypothetical protein
MISAVFPGNAEHSAEDEYGQHQMSKHGVDNNKFQTGIHPVGEIVRLRETLSDGGRDADMTVRD